MQDTSQKQPSRSGLKTCGDPSHTTWQNTKQTTNTQNAALTLLLRCLPVVVLISRLDFNWKHPALNVLRKSLRKTICPNMSVHALWLFSFQQHVWVHRIHSSDRNTCFSENNTKLFRFLVYCWLQLKCRPFLSSHGRGQLRTPCIVEWSWALVFLTVRCRKE